MNYKSKKEESRSGLWWWRCWPSGRYFSRVLGLKLFCLRWLLFIQYWWWEEDEGVQLNDIAKSTKSSLHINIYFAFASTFLPSLLSIKHTEVSIFFSISSLGCIVIRLFCRWSTNCATSWRRLLISIIWATFSLSIGTLFSSMLKYCKLSFSMLFVYALICFRFSFSFF